jgi:hypothetical protein
MRKGMFAYCSAVPREDVEMMSEGRSDILTRKQM